MNKTLQYCASHSKVTTCLKPTTIAAITHMSRCYTYYIFTSVLIKYEKMCKYQFLQNFNLYSCWEPTHSCNNQNSSCSQCPFKTTPYFKLIYFSVNKIVEEYQQLERWNFTCSLEDTQPRQKGADYKTHITLIKRYILVTSQTLTFYTNSFRGDNICHLLIVNKKQKFYLYVCLINLNNSIFFIQIFFS
eukprot:TRINITY_DN3864_c0_g1_i1.p5 TRINITY_DN3864_c0_g1~~TRINITY_DN3864_c0_g1_i1.p5  ORF type:complete len:189 (-),score=-15.34 TRINITY_DN3864_c0_g1_i1:963-1529(-)